MATYRFGYQSDTIVEDLSSTFGTTGILSNFWAGGIATAKAGTAISITAAVNPFAPLSISGKLWKITDDVNRYAIEVFNGETETKIISNVTTAWVTLNFPNPPTLVDGDYLFLLDGSFIGTLAAKVTYNQSPNRINDNSVNLYGIQYPNWLAIFDIINPYPVLDTNLSNNIYVTEELPPTCYIPLGVPANNW